MAASVAWMMLLGMMGLAVMAEFEDYMGSPTWDCGDTPMQANVTIQDIMGDWYMWDFYATTPNVTTDICRKMSLKMTSEDSYNNNTNRTPVNVTTYELNEGRTQVSSWNTEAYFEKDKPYELIELDEPIITNYRVEYLAADRSALLLTQCLMSRKFWLLLGADKDNTPADVQRPSSPILRRYAEICRQRELAISTGNSTSNSNTD